MPRPQEVEALSNLNPEPLVLSFHLSRAGLVDAAHVPLSVAREMVRRRHAVWIVGRSGGRPTIFGTQEPLDPAAPGNGLLVRVVPCGAGPADDGSVPPLFG